LQERKRGYNTALKEKKVAGKKSWIKEVSTVRTKEDVEKAINDLLILPEQIDAILFASNYLSMYGMKHINTLPVKVPDNLALVSFDESDAADLFYAPLTHMKQPLREMGEMAAKILLESIDRNNKIMQVNMEPELIIRKSTTKKI
jgi:LacI family transcriptional regulator